MGGCRKYFSYSKVNNKALQFFSAPWQNFSWSINFYIEFLLMSFHNYRRFRCGWCNCAVLMKMAGKAGPITKSRESMEGLLCYNPLDDENTRFQLILLHTRPIPTGNNYTPTKSKPLGINRKSHKNSNCRWVRLGKRPNNRFIRPNCPLLRAKERPFRTINRFQLVLRRDDVRWVARIPVTAAAALSLSVLVGVI